MTVSGIDLKKGLSIEYDMQGRRKVTSLDGSDPKRKKPKKKARKS